MFTTEGVVNAFLDIIFPLQHGFYISYDILATRVEDNYLVDCIPVLVSLV